MPSRAAYQLAVNDFTESRSRLTTQERRGPTNTLLVYGSVIGDAVCSEGLQRGAAAAGRISFGRARAARPRHAEQAGPAQERHRLLRPAEKPEDQPAATSSLSGLRAGPSQRNAPISEGELISPMPKADGFRKIVGKEFRGLRGAFLIGLEPARQNVRSIRPMTDHLLSPNPLAPSVGLAPVRAILAGHPARPQRARA